MLATYILKLYNLRENMMKKLIALFAPVLLATSFFVAPVSAIEINQLDNQETIQHIETGRKYQDCLMAGDAGCKANK